MCYNKGGMVTQKLIFNKTKTYGTEIIIENDHKPGVSTKWADTSKLNKLLSCCIVLFEGIYPQQATISYFLGQYTTYEM